jgi:hypothetical protein
MRDDIVWQFRQRQRDRENGVKHTPLHTLQECCEAAGIDHRAFGRYAAKYPDAPKPVLQHEKTRWKAGKKYYRKHEFVQWVNQVRQQKEKAMPDIKTALQQALAKTANTWAADDEAHQKIEPVKTETPEENTMPTTKQDHRITNNVSRATFEFVRDNPGMTIDEITNALVARGFKANSVSSLCYQMMRVRLVVADANGKLTAVVREYAPIQANKRRRKATAKVAKPVAKPEVVQEAAPAQRKYVEITSKRTGEVINPRKEEWTVDSVIGGLNVRQAMAVYDELRGIFGA